jgi:hypothetical protein
MTAGCEPTLFPSGDLCGVARLKTPIECLLVWLASACFPGGRSQIDVLAFRLRGSLLRRLPGLSLVSKVYYSQARTDRHQIPIDPSPSKAGCAPYGDRNMWRLQKLTMAPISKASKLSSDPIRPKSRFLAAFFHLTALAAY